MVFSYGGVTLSEVITIQQAVQGDAAAWEALVRDHQQAVFRLAYLFVRDADDAEDVAQDAFVRAFRALPTFDVSRPLRPWLLQIAANLARNRRRSLRRYLAVLQRVWRMQPTAVSQPNRLDSAWESDQLHQALEQLRPAEREIIYARYFLELSEADTAEVLGVALGTVKSRLSRAMKRLRTVIDADFSFLRKERES
jgi:RNA polymerase sigma-70 factor (ECF subfamily)